MRGDVLPEEASKPIYLELEDVQNKVDRIIPYNRLSRLTEQEGFIDLFCGAGGFTIGFSKAGWKPLLGVDFDKKVKITVEKTFRLLRFLLMIYRNRRILIVLLTDLKARKLALWLVVRLVKGSRSLAKGGS